jgi:hypothetical protein
MRLILLRSTCDIGRTYPNINLTDRGTYVVQGYQVAGLDLAGHILAADESIVEVPESLVARNSTAPRRAAARSVGRTGERFWCVVAQSWTPKRYGN